MNILLLSDSHGHPDRIREAAERTRPDCILFAGDGLRDLAGAHTAPDVPVYAVRGNCDARWDPLTAQYPEEQILVLDGVRILLSGEGYHIIEAENGTRALEVFRPEVDLVILDIMMPGMSGLRVCEELRKLSTVPILFLTAKSQESDKLLGLTAGGDDYLPKPFSFAELSARVKALLRRYCVYQGKGQAPARAENLTLCSHGVKLALDCNRAWVDGEEIDLTETEYKILRLLMQSPQRIFPVQVIYEDVWQEPYFYTSNGTVMVHIRNLRMKIEKDPQNPARLQTMWGKGYRFVPGEEKDHA